MDVSPVSIEGHREALAVHRFVFEAKLEDPDREGECTDARHDTTE